MHFASGSGEPFDSFSVDMEALELKEEAQQLQEAGRYEEALPLMLRSVKLREGSHTLCLNLSEFAELYLDMLKLDAVDVAARRMLVEAHRYDETNQRRIANKLLEDVERARKSSLILGMPVRMEGLTSRIELNGQEGVIRGKLRESGCYMVAFAPRRNL